MVRLQCYYNKVNLTNGFEFRKMSQQSTAGDTLYFVDFDNTISQRDVWDSIVRVSAPDAWKEVIAAYVEGRISSRECNLRLAGCVRIPEPEARELVYSIGIDPTFHDFVRFARERNAPITILSDGYDYYIDLLLKREGLDSLTVFCNRMIWSGAGIEVEFPLIQPECERDMAHCKCQHLQNITGKRRVYIGDGVSDTCAARKCEAIYAKRNLLDYCREEGLEHKPFESFLDVIEFEKEALVAEGVAVG